MNIPSIEALAATALVDTDTELAAAQTSAQQVTVSPTTIVACVAIPSELSAAFDVHLIGSTTASHDDVPVQHVNPRLQHDLELWQRIKEYDKNAAQEPPFTAVLTKKQKQMMRMNFLIGSRRIVPALGDPLQLPKDFFLLKYSRVQCSSSGCPSHFISHLQRRQLLC